MLLSVKGQRLPLNCSAAASKKEGVLGSHTQASSEKTHQGRKGGQLPREATGKLQKGMMKMKADR